MNLVVLYTHVATYVNSVIKKCVVLLYIQIERL